VDTRDQTDRWLRHIYDGKDLAVLRSSLQTTSPSHYVPAAMGDKSHPPAQSGGPSASRTTQGNAMHDGSNITLGMRVHNALVEAAQAKNEAFKLERKYKRTLKAHILIAEGKSHPERETRASLRDTVKGAEDAWIAAQMLANTAEAEANGLEIQFKEWQSRNATNRAEMNLR
jgi:hypothetical protein